MVCLGNICRSPLAEGILRSKVNPEKVHVDSAGTGDYNIDIIPDPRSLAVAKLHGLDISLQRGRQFQAEDFDRFDLIYAMDHFNFEDVISLARNQTDKNKVHLILNEVFPGENVDVPDPYRGANPEFEKVFKMLEEACEIIASKLKES